jgi:channel protein (hemolysin III family)
VPSTVSFLGFAEPVASWLHLLGAVLAAWFARDLMRRGASRADRVALAVFGFATVFALSMSGVYHLLDPAGEARGVLQRLDHAAIWLLIAGTFTPVHVTMFRGPLRWGVLGFVWLCAICGIVFKTIFFAEFPEALGLGLYLGLGWLGAISGAALARHHGRRAVWPLMHGGLAYSIGGLASVIEAPILIPGVLGHHELFHLAVLGGVFMHWRLMRDLEQLRTIAVAAPQAAAPSGALAPAWPAD